MILRGQSPAIYVLHQRTRAVLVRVTAAYCGGGSWHGEVCYEVTNCSALKMEVADWSRAVADWSRAVVTLYHHTDHHSVTSADLMCTDIV